MTPEQRDAIRALERDGELTPQEVVEAATPEESILHRLFEWDDGKAGVNFRLDQARRLIARVRVTYVVPTPLPERHVRIEYVRDPDRAPGEAGYRRAQLVSYDPGRIERVMAAELARIAGNVQRSRQLADSFGVRESFEAKLRVALFGTIDLPALPEATA